MKSSCKVARVISPVQPQHSICCLYSSFLQDKGRVKACIFYETFWLPRQTPVSSPMELEKCQMKSHKGARYNEKELLLYIDDYYRDSRGVHRVPPVLFHVDSWKVKDETKKKANSPDASGRETETASGTHTRPQSVGLPLEDGKQRNQSEPNGETPSQAEVLAELKLESNGAIGNDCSTNNQEDVDDPRKHTKAKGTMSKTTSGKGKGKGNDEPQQKVNSRDEFVTHISLMSDIDVQNKEVDDLHKLTDNQKVEIMRKRKELKAVDKVASFVETFAEVGKYNMFILTDYIYTSYLQLVERKNKKFITNIPGDHDILVIWKEVGILFFQVKSNLKGHGPKTIVGDITHALQQLLSDKYVFWQSNRDLSFISKLPIYCFIAEPFLEEARLDDFRICQNHKKLILTKSVFESNESFQSWVRKNILVKSNDLPFEDDEYRLLAARYVGYASLRTLPNPIKTAGQQLDRIYLNPEQLSVLKNKNKFQIIAGNYGTGKTLMLSLLAEDILTTNEQALVHCITCSDISREGFSNPNSPFQSPNQMMKLLNKEIKDKGIQSKTFGQVYKDVCDNVQTIPRNILVTTKIFFESLSKLIDSNGSSREQHILLDEVPFVLFGNDKESSKYIDEFIEHLSTNAYFWISIASHTYKVDVQKEEDPVKTLQGNFPTNFKLSYLKYAMRVSKRQFQMIREIENFTQDGHHKFSECGHVVDGPMPRLYALSTCKCNPKASAAPNGKTYLPCDCSSKRLTDVLNTVLKFIGKDQIVVLIEYGVEGPFYNKMCNIVETALQKQKTNWVLAFKSDSCSPAVKTSENENAITVGDGRTYRGCENRVTIVIDPFYMCQWFRTEGHVGVPTMVLTRCLSQYIHITWPKEECLDICKQALTEYDNIIAKSGGAKIWQDIMTEFVRQARQTATATDTKVMLLDGLVAKRLIIDCREENS